MSALAHHAATDVYASTDDYDRIKCVRDANQHDWLCMYAFHLRPRGSNGTVAVRLIVVVWPVRSMHRAAVLVLLAGETSLSGSS